MRIDFKLTNKFSENVEIVADLFMLYGNISFINSHVDVKSEHHVLEQKNMVKKEQTLCSSKGD